MIASIEQLVAQFECRTLSRRQLVASIATLVAAAAATTEAQPAQVAEIAQGLHSPAAVRPDPG